MSILRIVRALSVFVVLPLVTCCGEEMIQFPEYNLGMESANSAEEANAIAKYAKEKLEKDQQRATVYAKAGENAAVLIIYGVEVKDAQTKFFELIEVEQKWKGWRSIHIEFRKHEVWIEKPNGVKERGNEKILAIRTVPAKKK